MVRTMSETLDHQLEELAAPAGRLPIPRLLGRARVVQAFNDAFEMIGGIPRLATWADAHPTEFYKLMARVNSLQVQINTGDVHIHHALPPVKALDGEIVDASLDAASTG